MTSSNGNEVQIGSLRRWYPKLVFFVSLLGAVALGLTNLEVIATKVGSLLSRLSGYNTAILTKKECWDISVKHAKIFPYSLNYSLPGKMGVDFHWYYVEFKNNCTYKLALYITFEPPNVLGTVDIDEPNLKHIAGPIKFDPLLPGEQMATPINPKVKFQAELKRIYPLTMTWAVMNSETKKELGSKTVTIDVLPRNRFVWNLGDLNGKQVPKEFLLASLTSWTLGAESGVEAEARNVRQEMQGDFGDNLAEFAREWLHTSVKLLFKSEPRRLEIEKSRDVFPPPLQRGIEPPVKILKDLKRPTALEAALLIRAIS